MHIEGKMKKQLVYIIAITAFISGSCSYSKKFSREFFRENETMLNSLQHRYREHYKERPFSIEIKDRDFQQVSLEILTDTVRYIYSFYLDDPALVDTLRKYRFNISFMEKLIEDMRTTHCTWLTHLEYYENLKKQQLVFLSIRHRRLESFLKKDKYFTLAFFQYNQPFDERGRLLDRANKKVLRKINGAVFFKMTDSVAYAISSDFR